MDKMVEKVLSRKGFRKDKKKRQSCLVSCSVMKHKPLHVHLTLEKFSPNSLSWLPLEGMRIKQIQLGYWWWFSTPSNPPVSQNVLSSSVLTFENSPNYSLQLQGQYPPLITKQKVLQIHLQPDFISSSWDLLSLPQPPFLETSLPRTTLPRYSPMPPALTQERVGYAMVINTLPVT